MNIYETIALVEGAKNMIGSAIVLSLKDYKTNRLEILFLEYKIKKLRSKLKYKKIANNEIKNFVKDCAPESLDVDSIFEEADKKVLEEFKAKISKKRNVEVSDCGE